MHRVLCAAALCLLLVSPALSATGILTRENPAEHRFRIEAGDRKAVLIVRWKDRAAEVDLLLVSPRGVSLRGPVPGLEIQEDPVGYRVAIGSGLDASLGREGEWTVRLRLTASHRKRPEVPYVFEVQTGSSMKLVLAGLGGVQRVDRPAELSVRARSEGPGEPPRLKRCTVSVIRVGGGASEVELRDDGEAPDKRGADGTFSARWSWPEPGEYTLVVTAEGARADGRAFILEEIERLEVRPPAG